MPPLQEAACQDVMMVVAPAPAPLLLLLLQLLTVTLMGRRGRLASGQCCQIDATTPQQPTKHLTAGLLSCLEGERPHAVATTAAKHGWEPLPALPVQRQCCQEKLKKLADADTLLAGSLLLQTLAVLLAWPCQ